MTDKKKKVEGSPVTGITVHTKGRKPERVTKAEAAKRLDTANEINKKDPSSKAKGNDKKTDSDR